MVDFSFIGKDGLIIQYEDIISLIGFNVAQYFHGKGVNDKLDRMSVEDILKSYFNRQTEDIPKWLKESFNIDFDMSMCESSILAVRPNNMYAYKVFDTAMRHMLKNLIIFSDISSIHIDRHIESSFEGINVNYISNTDILDVLKKYPNSTFITSSCNNIRKCCNTNVPTVLTIVDDYDYIINVMNDETIKKFDNIDNVYVQYTSILSAGFF